MNKNKIIILIIWTILSIYLVSLLYSNIKLNNKIKVLENKKSNTEIISTTIINKKNSILSTDKEIKELESKKQKLELEVTCWKNQLDRLVDWLEYNLQYCADENNLSKFKEDFQ